MRTKGESPALRETQRGVRASEGQFNGNHPLANRRRPLNLWNPPVEKPKPDTHEEDS